MEELFEWLIPACFNFIRHDCKSFIPTSELHQIQSFVRVFRSFLKGDSNASSSTAATTTPSTIIDTAATFSQSTVWIQYCFIFSIVWSLGATLVQESRDKFDTFYRSLLTGNVKDCPKPKSFKLNKNQLFPEKGSVFDYICDKRNNQWVFWMDIVDREHLKIAQNAKVCIQFLHA
jgi:dynein heavy chain